MAVLTALLALSLAAPLPGRGAAQAMRLGGEERPVAAADGFDGVGRLECRSSGGRAVVHDATGWILGAADTVVTAAHTFYPRDGAVDPRLCVFRLFNPDGSTREAVRIRYVRSPWADTRYRSDSAHDVAILKLDRPLRVRAIPAAAPKRELGGGRVRLISLPGDTEDRRARVSAGEVRPFPLPAARDAQGGMRVSDPSLLFASSVDSAAGSSGGMYVSRRSGEVVGLHVGYACGGPDGCFNFGVRFDGTVLAMIAAVASDSSTPAGTMLASAAL